jgi:hypothetical protein
MIHESPSATKPVSSSSPYQIIKCSADIKKKRIDQNYFLLQLETQYGFTYIIKIKRKLIENK